MNLDRPKEIKDAVELLEEFERSVSHTKRRRCFEDAIDILNEYREETPDSPHKEYINNIKYVYTRKLIEQLKDISDLDLYPYRKGLNLVVETLSWYRWYSAK